jgi:hypothetical protein
MRFFVKNGRTRHFVLYDKEALGVPHTSVRALKTMNSVDNVRNGVCMASAWRDTLIRVAALPANRLARRWARACFRFWTPIL